MSQRLILRSAGSARRILGDPGLPRAHGEEGGFHRANTDDRGTSARWRRKLRRRAIDTLWHAQAGHPGGSLSAAEILAALFFQVMRVDPAEPQWEERDRFVLSKGHAATDYYVTLQQRGFFPADVLAPTTRSTPVCRRTPTATLRASTCRPGRSARGSRRVSAWRLAPRLKSHDFARLRAARRRRVQEGQVWEAAMAPPSSGLAT